MLVHLVNFEKCHSAIHSWLSPTGTVSAALTKKMAGCDFSHFDLQDLEAGIHPFGTTYRSPQSCTKLQQALSVYGDLRKGTSASLLDFQVLLETEKIGIPYSMTEVTYCFKSVRVLLHALLGSLHPLVQAWDNFVSMWIGREARLSKNLDMHQFVLVLCWLQIRFSTWLTDQHRKPVHISVPEFTMLITKILYEEAWEPSLPSRYQVFSSSFGSTDYSLGKHIRRCRICAGMVGKATALMWIKRSTWSAGGRLADASSQSRCC
jgi:hypothetical protein